MTVPAPDEVQRLADAMARYADGDPRAFVLVYETLAPVVERCMRRWINDPALAEDLVQETFLRVHRARHRYRTGAPVGPWVVTIARRLSIDAHRRRGSNRVHLTREGAVPEVGVPPPEPVDDVSALVTEVRDAIAGLPESLRSVVQMHKLEGRPMAEVAEALGINEGAARVRAHRGYKRLRDRLARVFDKET